MHRLLRAGILITFGVLIICTISGCADDDLTGEGEVKLLVTVPEDGGTVSGTGELKIIFDGFPKSVYVDGKPATIQDNTAILKIIDLPNLSPGTQKTVAIEWRNQENFLAGSKTITFTILKPVTVVVDPAPGPLLFITDHGRELTLEFSEAVKSVKVNGRSATGSGRDWMVWFDHFWMVWFDHLPHRQTPFLNIEWTNQDGSTDTMEAGPHDIIFDDGGAPPAITSATVIDGEVEVDPAPINAGGFRFDFDEPVTGTIKLTDEAGIDLNWIANVVGQTATLIAIAGQELVNGTTYKIEIDVVDGGGNSTRTTITFATKPK